MTGDSHAALLAFKRVVTADLMLIYIYGGTIDILDSLSLISSTSQLQNTPSPKKLPTLAENDSPFSSKYLQSDSKSLSRLCNSFAAFGRQRFVSEIEISSAHKQNFTLQDWVCHLRIHMSSNQSVGSLDSS